MITCEKVVCHSPGPGIIRHHVVLDDSGQVLGRIGDPDLSDEAGVELDKLVKAYRAEHDVTYKRASDIVMSRPENSGLVHLYSGIPRDTGPERPTTIMSSPDAGHEIARLAREHMARHCVSYSEASAVVMEENSELKTAYAVGACMGDGLED